MDQQQEPDGTGNRQRNGKAPRRFRNDADRPRGCRRLGHDTQDTCSRVTQCAPGDRAGRSRARAERTPQNLAAVAPSTMSVQLRRTVRHNWQSCRRQAPPLSSGRVGTLDNSRTIAACRRAANRIATKSGLVGINGGYICRNKSSESTRSNRSLSGSSTPTATVAGPIGDTMGRNVRM